MLEKFIKMFYNDSEIERKERNESNKKGQKLNSSISIDCEKYFFSSVNIKLNTTRGKRFWDRSL